MSSATAVADLIATCPAWAKVIRKLVGGFEFEAQPTLASGKAARSYVLTVSADPIRRTIAVREVPLNRLLPEKCPQRHINDDGTFCLGLRADNLVDDRLSADDWWSKLSVFLSCQETAEEMREWPPTLQMSHGDAAVVQLEAEALAEQLGQREEYNNAVAFGVGPIAVYVHAISAVTGRLKTEAPDVSVAGSIEMDDLRSGGNALKIMIPACHFWRPSDREQRKPFGVRAGASDAAGQCVSVH